jgi:hypothetical protein
VNCTSVGPLFVADPTDRSDASRALMSARSYAPPARRGEPLPPGRSPDTLYVRQCSRQWEHSEYPDALIWGVPDVVRSILDPEDNALHFADAPARLERGDMICLGTPGGVVITSKPQRIMDILDTLLFWWRPKDWHDAFFDPDRNLYLHDGDRLFLWAEGLGFQLHEIARQDAHD